MIQEITSLQNPRIAALRALHRKKHRETDRAFLVEGEKMASEALSGGMAELLIGTKDMLTRPFQGLATEAEAHGVPVLSVPEHIIEALSESKTPQGILAKVRMQEDRQLPEGLLLALDAVQDPGNVGTMLRTADAAGWQGVLLGHGCADVYGAKCVQASMGSIFRMPVFRDVDLLQELTSLRGQGVVVAAAVLDGEDVYRMALPVTGAVLVIGNESAGISLEITALATHRLCLPMRGGAESLNAAVAAGILMYEWKREGRP